MIVVDASVLANATTDDGPLGARARAELARDVHWAAPEHILVEVFSAIRGRWLGHQISEARARDAVAATAAAVLDLVAVKPLLGPMWELRHTVSGYDAAYVALAETYDCALVTADLRLARAAELACEVRRTLPAP